MRGASPNGLHPWLHEKPLDAAIGQVSMLYCLDARHGQQFWTKPKNTTKTQLLPIFLMVDWRKKAKQFGDPKQTLYSHHRCNKLRTNVKHHYSSWRAQLHFELSNVVNGQKFKKLLTLNKAQKHLWAIYGPIAVKLLSLSALKMLHSSCRLLMFLMGKRMSSMVMVLSLKSNTASISCKFFLPMIRSYNGFVPPLGYSTIPGRRCTF